MWQVTLKKLKDQIFYYESCFSIEVSYREKFLFT
jgi:hypothetical protein